MPRRSNRRNGPARPNPEVMSVAELQALPRNSLILMASARNLVTTGTKNLLAQRVFEHEHNKNNGAHANTQTLNNPPTVPQREQQPDSHFSAAQLSQLRDLVNEAVSSQRSGSLQLANSSVEVPPLSPASGLHVISPHANSGPEPFTEPSPRLQIQDGASPRPQQQQQQLEPSPSLARQNNEPLLQGATPQGDFYLPPLPEKLRSRILKHHSVPSTSTSGRLASYPSPPVRGDPLADRLAFLQSQAIADSTRRSYLAGLRRYTAFCSSKQWTSFPATETTLRYFAAHLSTQVAFKTIKLYMAGIRYAHIENSLPDPFQDAPLLHLLLRGIKRSIGLSSQRRLPITMTLLRQLKGELSNAPDISPQDKLMLWSAFTLAFYGFLRSSEFTSPSTTQFNPLVHLCLTDVSFTAEGCLRLHLKSSKTDPYRQGCSLLIAPSQHSVCAVRALRKYLSIRIVTGSAPLYVFSSGLYLTRDKVTTVLRTLLQRLNIPTELYASHSFRIGAATTAAEAGLPPWLIQTLGRWSSNCFTLYIRTPPSILQKVPSMLATASTSDQGIWNPAQGRCTMDSSP